MDKLTFEVEAVTPIFIAGADQKNIENEGLRPPSLKGLLRWWFRTIMGGMVSVNDLKKLENKIFGFTNQKSNIKVLTTTESKPSDINILTDLNYLWFSVFLQKRKSQRLQCYSPKTRFKIILGSDDKNCLKIASGCLWAIVYLGGVGARLRRGAGSLKVNNSSSNVPYTFIFTGNTVVDAKKFMEENLAKIFEDFKEYAGERYSPQTNLNFAILSHAKVSLIEQPFNKWENGLEKVSNVYKSHRVDRDVTERFIWGLPILSRQNLKRYENLLRELLSKRLNKEDVDEEIKRLKGLKEEELLREIEESRDKTRWVFLKLLLLEKLRQASPLFIGVMDLNGTYAIRIVKFYTSIHPKFSSNTVFLKRDLDCLNDKLANELGEIEIEIPKVR